MWLAIFILSFAFAVAQQQQQCVTVPLSPPVSICGVLSLSTAKCMVNVAIRAEGFLIYQQDISIDQSHSAAPCPQVGPCAACVELSQTNGGQTCAELVLTCPSQPVPVRLELGCLNDVGPLAHCAGPSKCICNEAHSSCSSTGQCVCKDGWKGEQCNVPPGAFLSCGNFTNAQAWVVCGSVNVEECDIVASLSLGGNQLLNQTTPLLKALHTGGVAQCISVSQCNLCLSIQNLRLDSSSTRIGGQLAASLSGCGEQSLALGSFSRNGDFADLETRCAKTCPLDCSGPIAGSCGTDDGTCKCNQTGGFYGPGCQYRSCGVCPAGNGDCNALTGVCVCASGFEGPKCEAKSNLSVILGVVAFFAVSASVVGAVYWWWRKRQRQRVTAMNFMQDSDSGMASDFDDFNVAEDDDLVL